ncbi:MAG: transposase [Bradyrhizobium sp.]|nr:transposase [Bradyrhizobium sp.]
MRRHTQEAILDCINQLEHLRDNRLRRLLAAHKASMERTLARLDRCLVELIAEHADLSERLRSVPAVGPVLATTLIAQLPELGSLTRRQVASLVGVALFDRSSGRQIGAKSIQAGRVFVRNTLYMAAMVASQHNPAIAVFAERLAGKPGKVRPVACMRKLIVMLNAVVRDGSQWLPRTTRKQDGCSAYRGCGRSIWFGRWPVSAIRSTRVATSVAPRDDKAFLYDSSFDTIALPS